MINYTTQMTQADAAVLETMIDKYTLSGVLSQVSEICMEKAEHVRSNWQDRALADAWDKCGRSVGRVAVRVLDWL